MQASPLPKSLVPRVPQLDGLRGIAAVTVLLLHLSLAFPSHVNRWFLRPFFTGGQAVILFFVLSGYVLSLPFWAGKTVPYPHYAASRFARIYLPFFVAASLSIAGALVARHHPLYLTPWFNQTWHTTIAKETVLAQFMMYPFPAFNTALWSLRYELHLSIVLPLLLWFARRTNVIVLTAAWYVVMFRDLGLLVWRLRQYGMVDMIATLGIASFFLLGACAARYHGEIEAALQRKAAARWLLFAVSFWIYCATQTGSNIQDSWVPCSLAALGLILVAISSRRAGAVLGSRLGTYLGHISYSLYLTHSFVLFGLSYILYGRIPVAALVILILVCSFALAHVFYRAVEVPSIWLSRQLRNGVWLPRLGMAHIDTHVLSHAPAIGGWSAELRQLSIENRDRNVAGGLKTAQVLDQLVALARFTPVQQTA